MAYRLVGQDCDVDIADGGAWDGDNTLAAATNVKARAKSVRIAETVSVHEMAGLGDNTRKIRPQRSSYRAEATLQVLSTGILSGLAVGNVAALTLDPLATTTTTGVYTYPGIVMENSLDIVDGEQIQRLVIEGPSEGVVS